MEANPKLAELAQTRAKLTEIYNNPKVLTTTKELLDLVAKADALERELKGEIVGNGWDKFMADFKSKHADWFTGKVEEERPDTVSHFYRDRAKVMNHVKDFKVISSDGEDDRNDMEFELTSRPPAG